MLNAFTHGLLQSSQSMVVGSGEATAAMVSLYGAFDES